MCQRRNYKYEILIRNPLNLIIKRHMDFITDFISKSNIFLNFNPTRLIFIKQQTINGH